MTVDYWSCSKIDANQLLSSQEPSTMSIDWKNTRRQIFTNQLFRAADVKDENHGLSEQPLFSSRVTGKL